MSAVNRSNTVPVATQGITVSPILGSVALCANVPIGPFSISLCI